MRTIRIQIQENLDASHALLDSSRFARELGFDGKDTRKISTVVSELARNILKYAEKGEIILGEVDKSDARGISIKAVDSGPGIVDTDAALQDHYSTGGTLGLGLPGVRRLVDDFDLESRPGEGTTVTATLYHKPSTHKSVQTQTDRRLRSRKHAEALSSRVREKKNTPGTGVEFGKKIRPCRGEKVSGDALFLKRHGQKVFMGIIDGLGHGPSAHTVAEAALQFLSANPTIDPAKQLVALDKHLTGTAGAAVGLCLYDVKTRRGIYAAVGNTVARVIGTPGVQLRSQPGIVGSYGRSPTNQEFSMGIDDVLLLYSDGVPESFSLSDYPQLPSQGAQTIASNLVRRFGKDLDDASCLVMRYVK